MSTIITFIKEKRKILASLFLTIGIFSAMVDGVILVSRPQTYRSKAAISEVVFKNSAGEILPVNENGLSISAIPEVMVELNPEGDPKSYKVGENPSDLSLAELKSYQDPPVKFTYKFQNLQNNTGTLFVEFFYQNDQTKRVTSSVLVNQLSDVLQLVEFTSPKGLYQITYDKRYWSVGNFGPRVIFNLNKEYGSARLDIIEGESGKDLASLTDEIIKGAPGIPAEIESSQFKDAPAYLVNQKEEVLGQEVYFQKLIVKADQKYFIFEKRAPKLGYNQNYLDSLLEGFSFKSRPKTEVKGISESLNDLSTVELVDLVRPSIVNIVYAYCLDIINLKPEVSGLSKPKYNFCAFGKGSGFIINEEGLIATNGHVAKVYPEEGLVTNLLYEGNKDFSTDLIKGIFLSKGQTPAQNQIEDFYKELNLNPQYLDRFLTEIFRLIENKIISVHITNEKYYVNVGSEPVKIDYQKMNQGDYLGAITPSSTTFTAKSLDFNYPNKYSYDAVVNKNYQRGADVALLKIDKSSKFPALQLGNIENLREGSEIVIAGYPTLVEGEKDPRAALSYKTSTKPTITRGIVSALKKDLTDKVVIQTDASIDHGNSGGPAFNPEAEVIGIATFSVESQSGNFNFLREVGELKELMSKNKVENNLGDIGKLWRAGLDNFNNHYYQKAKEDFQQVKTLSSSHPTVDEFIKSSEESIAKGESLEGLAGLIKGKGSNVMLVVFGGISGVSFMMAGFLAMLPLFIKEETYVG